MLFSDRRSGVLHDIGMNAPPTHDPAQGLVGWASAHHDTQRGLAATFVPQAAQRAAAQPKNPYAFKPSITSPAEQRGMAGRMGAASRTGAWASGPVASQTVLPGQPMRTAGRPQTVLPSFVGQKVKAGPSFAQRTRRAVRMP